jgi:hypothetical protein
MALTHFGLNCPSRVKSPSIVSKVNLQRNLDFAKM